MARAEHIVGNTGCLYITGNGIPYYQTAEKEWILMDSGFHGARGELAAYLKEHEIRVKAVLCSHAHFDHVENCRYLQETYGAQIIMSGLDAGMLESPVTLKAVFYSNTINENIYDFGDMVCKADKILMPGQKQVEVCGADFEILYLPGHAASHLGFVTPDGAAYLADSMFSRDMLASGKLFYMLCWPETLKTLEKIKDFHYNRYILSHSGVVEDIRTLAEENELRFLQILEEIRELITEEITLEQLVAKVVESWKSPVKRLGKARLFERIIRSMSEYLVDEGQIQYEIKNGYVYLSPI